MPRFAILEHDHPMLHWDLLLEAGDVLSAWRLAQPPDESAHSIEATKITDHRTLYLDYEGPVSGERGFVKRWDRGIYVQEPNSTPEVRRLRFDGERLHAYVILTRIHDAQWRWEFVTAFC
jgi:hypothetical protein